MEQISIDESHIFNLSEPLEVHGFPQSNISLSGEPSSGGGRGPGLPQNGLASKAVAMNWCVSWRGMKVQEWAGQWTSLLLVSLKVKRKQLHPLLKTMME